MDEDQSKAGAHRRNRSDQRSRTVAQPLVSPLVSAAASDHVDLVADLPDLTPSSPRALHTTALPPPPTTTATTRMTATSSGGAAHAAPVAPAASKRKTPKPNRQRCKEFRERRKQHVGGLEERVQALRDQVSELVTTKSIYTSKMLLKRHHPHGSLEKLVREYFTLFRYGVPVERPLRATATTATTTSRSSALVKAQTQRDFLHRIVDPEAVYGDHKGPGGSLAQWTYYTAAYASFVGDVNRVNIAGPEEDPIVYCFTTYHVIISRNTIKYLFPHAVHNEDLISRIIGMYVPVPVIGIFRFTEDGRIVSETANIELADALLSAGCLVEDVEELMTGFVISKEGTVPDELQAEEHHLLTELLTELDVDLEEGKEDAQAKEKLRISFLLDQEADAEEKENTSRKSNNA